MTSGKKIFLGMVIVALSGLLLGAAASYMASKLYLNNKVLADMRSEGYVLTNDATATAEDIVSGKSAFINSELVEGNIIVFDTSDATATSDVILRGKTAYINGELVVGTLDESKEFEIIPSTVAHTIEGGYYIANDIVIKGDPNCVPKNIKKGIPFFDFIGTYPETVQPDPQPEDPAGE